MDTLFKHRSIRKFKEDQIPKKLLAKILEAGSRASTTGNMQLYSVVVTRESENKAKLAPYHFNQGMVTQASVLLTICADLNRFDHWCKERNAEAGYDNLLWLMNATIDAILFAQNVCIAAEDNGLGICYLGTALYNAPEIIQELELPQGVIPLTAISMGYPDENPALNDRLPLEAVVHFEKYSDYSTDKINALYADKEALESSKNFVEENKKENLAQVFTDVRYKKADNLFFSEKLLKTIREQGFNI